MVALAPVSIGPEEMTVGVLGAGTMGAGIAQVAAQAGAQVVLYDIEQRFLDRGRQAIEDSLGRFVRRGRLSEADRDAVLGRFQSTTDLHSVAPADLVVEAVPEDPALKERVFQQLVAICRPEAILASNTSSLSVTEIGRRSGRPEQVVGMHFFNPPPLMGLVEIVEGAASDRGTVEKAVQLARRMGKTPVRCRDTAGFIVNRVARPFYLEGMYLLGEGLLDVPGIDAAARSLGFPMGPFQLMDLIGVDVNFAVTTSIFEQRFFEPRLRPHPIQRDLVRAGHFGRKSGVGFYSYASEPPAAVVTPRTELAHLPPGPWGRWAEKVNGDDRTGMAGGRILCSVVNEACYALGEGIASAEDIDTALKLGTNYPRGPLAWMDEVGPSLVLETLEELERWYGDGRHVPAPVLRVRSAA